MKYIKDAWYKITDTSDSFRKCIEVKHGSMKYSEGVNIGSYSKISNTCHSITNRCELDVNNEVFKFLPKNHPDLRNKSNYEIY